MRWARNRLQLEGAITAAFIMENLVDEKLLVSLVLLLFKTAKKLLDRAFGGLGAARMKAAVASTLEPTKRERQSLTIRSTVP
jgi:hypothetical protein